MWTCCKQFLHYGLVYQIEITGWGGLRPCLFREDSTAAKRGPPLQQPKDGVHPVSAQHYRKYLRRNIRICLSMPAILPLPMKAKSPCSLCAVPSKSSRTSSIVEFWHMFRNVYLCRLLPLQRGGGGWLGSSPSNRHNESQKPWRRKPIFRHERHHSRTANSRALSQLKTLSFLLLEGAWQITCAIKSRACWQGLQLIVDHFLGVTLGSLPLLCLLQLRGEHPPRPCLAI